MVTFLRRRGVAIPVLCLNKIRGEKCKAIHRDSEILERLTLEETAAEIGLSVSGVRKRLKNFRKELKEV